MTDFMFNNYFETDENKLRLKPSTVGLLLLVRHYLQLQSENHEDMARFLTREVSNLPDRTLGDLCGHITRLSDIRGIEIVKTMCDDLDSIDSVDAVVGLFSDTMKLVHPDDALEAQVDPASTFGLFLRKCVLAFLSLPFEGISRLYRGIVEYRGLKTQVPSATTSTLASGPGSAAFYPSGESAHDRFAAYDKKLHEQDVLAASACLHRYFDLLPAQKGADSTARHSHYASLNSASMLIRLGYMDEAQMAVAETIRASQQVQDIECLIHALILLSQILSSIPNLAAQQQEAHVLWRCIKLGIEHKLPYLTAVALLSAARLTIEWSGNGNGNAALEAHTAIALAEKIATRHGLDDLVGPCSLLMASSMANWGHLELAAAYAEAYLVRCDVSVSEPLSVSSILASPKSRPKSEGKNPSHVLDVCRALNILSMCDSAGGRHGQALQRIDKAKKLAHDHLDSGSVPPLLSRAAVDVLHNKALLSGEVWRALKLSSELCAVSMAYPPSLADSADSILRYTESLRLSMCHAESCGLSLQMSTVCAEAGRVQHSIAHLLSTIDSYISTCAFEAGLLPAFHCVAVSAAHGLNSQLALARVMLSELLRGLGLAGLGRQVCEEVLPLAVQHCSMRSVGRAHLCIAKCILSLSQSAGSSPKRLKNEALQSLARAQSCFSMSHSTRDEAIVCCIQARILHSLGRMEARNAISKRFRRLDEEMKAHW